MSNPFLSFLERRDKLSAEERQLVELVASRPRQVQAKRDIVREGSAPKDSCLMLSGFSARYHLLGDGRRQISAIHIAGDFVDLHSFLLGRMDHSVIAMTDCTVAMVPHDLLREITEKHPHFSRLLWLSTVIDAATYRQWLVASGRLSSAGQLSRFLCEMFVRLEVVHLTDGLSFKLPISQVDLSDAMGLSVVHVNRTLQDLRRQGLITWQGEQVRILDWEGLQRVAEFNPTYLNLQPIPR